MCGEVHRPRLILQVGVVSSFNVEEGTIVGLLNTLILSNFINAKLSLLIFLLKRLQEQHLIECSQPFYWFLCGDRRAGDSSHVRPNGVEGYALSIYVNGGMHFPSLLSTSN